MNQQPPTLWGWLRAVLAAWTGGMILGAGIVGLRRLLHGSADPFDGGWPLYLQSASLVCTFALGCWTRRPFITAIGVYLGYLGCLLASGGSEYPVSSSIALAVHGLAPAMVGAVAAFLLPKSCWSPAGRSPSASKGKPDAA